MQNNDLTQAIRKLEQETQKETLELHEKEQELRKIELETTELKNKLREHESVLIPKLRKEIESIKAIQRKQHNDLAQVQKNYQEALRKSNIKLR